MFGAAAGSCATMHREPGQGLTAAALSGLRCVPQTAWPSHRAAGFAVTRLPVGWVFVADPPTQSRRPTSHTSRCTAASARNASTEVRGQQHVTRALRNAVRDDRVAHAYLFSGPRGTGKTSTARILAMALNCEHLLDGEPDGVCLSCVEIRRGASMDVQELDAASNRGLDEMRDLLSRVALGVRGRWKVYIIDEVHQLTPNAASALLKTLEEPPGHVVFVLATTDPQKVLPTIRSRTQHFEFHLLGPRRARRAAALASTSGPASESRPRPSTWSSGAATARPATPSPCSTRWRPSASDVEDVATVVSEIVDGLAERDPGAGPAGRGRGHVGGARRPPPGRRHRRAPAQRVHGHHGRGLVMLPDDALAEVEEQARRLGPAALVRAMDGIGQALTDMRDSVDPTGHPRGGPGAAGPPRSRTRAPAALLERIERLERAVGVGGRDAGDLRGRGGRGGGPQPEPRRSEDSPASAGGSRPALGAPPPSTMGRGRRASWCRPGCRRRRLGELVLLGAGRRAGRSGPRRRGRGAGRSRHFGPAAGVDQPALGDGRSERRYAVGRA